MWVNSLFAQGARANDDPLRSPEVILGTIGLTLALLIGALVIHLTDRWRKRLTAGVETTSELSQFRAMFERGEITEEEYARLRDRVARRVKTALLSPTPASPTHPVPVTPQAAGRSDTLPGPDQTTPPPDPGNPANPAPSA